MVNKLYLVTPRGFCAGVEMAIKALHWLLKIYDETIYCYHEIVHNKWIVKIFEKNNVIDKNKALSKYIFNSLKNLINHPHVSDVRQHGMIAAVEIVKNKSTKEPYDWSDRRGIRAYQFGLNNGVLIRPLGNVIYFMPPYIIKKKEIDIVVNVIKDAIDVATK